MWYNNYMLTIRLASYQNKEGVIQHGRKEKKCNRLFSESQNNFDSYRISGSATLCIGSSWQFYGHSVHGCRFLYKFATIVSRFPNRSNTTDRTIYRSELAEKQVLKTGSVK